MVKIGKGGKLTLHIQGGKSVDMTKKALWVLNNTVEIQSGVKVKDIFLILKNNPDYLKTLSPVWAADFVKEGLGKKQKKFKALGKDCKVEFHWFLDQFTPGKLKIHPTPSVHGLQTGNGSFGLDFLSPWEIKDLSIVINESIEVESIQLSQKPTLGQVVYGLMWELSFYGPPKTRNKAKPT